LPQFLQGIDPTKAAIHIISLTMWQRQAAYEYLVQHIANKRGFHRQSGQDMIIQEKRMYTEKQKRD